MFNTCSPYLKMLFGKGINWHPYLSEELIDLAVKEGKLIFQHIGYMSNMHVREMAEKLFSDQRVVKILNDNFMCIAEDKESNPESYLIGLDLLFLNQDFSYGPMNLFVMTDRKPIICFSDCDPEYFLDVAGSIVEANKGKKHLLAQLSEELSKRAINTGVITNKITSDNITPEVMEVNARQWYHAMFENDFIYQTTPFTPNPSSLITLIDYIQYYKDQEVSDKIESLLDHLQFSALFDPIDGGFFKQANDYSCEVPFYEKTLEENAHFIHLYSLAYKLFKKESYRKTALLTYSFINEKLCSKNGGFIGSTTLTTSPEDSNYYEYSLNELMLMFPARYMDIALALGMDITLNKFVKQIPVRNSRTYNIIQDDEISILKERRSEHRGYYSDKREVTSYISQLVESLAASSVLLDEPFLYKDAVVIMEYLLLHNRNENGRLYRYNCCQKSSIPGYLSDYSDLIAALIELHKASGEANSDYKVYAGKYIDFVLKHFYKPENGMFSKSECSIQPDTIPFKRESNIDFLKPSANSIMAGNLISFYEISSNKEYLDIAAQQIMNIAPNLNSSGPMLASWAQKTLKYIRLTKQMV
ncbi:MAG: DUF255 domain-containing protein [Bacteroidales bacterium]|nr:DUF255 domain-containing protein [Bacteroidales bacterium]